MSIGVIVNGSLYTFDNDTYGYIVAADGFGMPGIDRYAQRGAQQHGDSDLGFRLQARRIMLVIQIPAANEVGFYQKRKALLDIFNPRNDIALVVTDGASMERRLDVVFEYAMSLPLEKDWQAQKIGINLKTSGLPAWYNPTAQSARVDGGGGGSTFTIPQVVPTAVGSVEANTSSVIYYAGTWDEFPRIIITGPITDCVIENTETGEKLDFTGFTLTAGHFIEIQTAYGRKTVLYDGVTNYVDKLTADSDLATFHIVPVTAGESVHENSLHLTGTAITGDTAVQIFYNDRYIGI